MAYIKPFLVVFGGNTGTEAVNDVWTFALNDTYLQFHSAILGVRY